MELQKARKPKEIYGNTMGAKMAELVTTKEELKRAQAATTQSWLDSKPLIDELETLKAALARAKNRASTSNNATAELELELETTTKSIRSEKEKELEARRMIEETSHDIDQMREELETLKQLTDEERRVRSKLKQIQRLRKQRIRTLQLTIRATRIESEAFGASAAEALSHIKNLEADNSATVQLTHEDYNALTRRANEETSLSDWRISVSLQQKQEAEASNTFALSRLNDLGSRKTSRTRRIKAKKKFGDGNAMRDGEEERDLDVVGVGEVRDKRGIDIPTARAKPVVESSRVDPPQMGRSTSKNNKKIVKNPKPSIFHLIKRCLVRKLMKLFR